MVLKKYCEKLKKIVEFLEKDLYSYVYKVKNI